MKRLNTILVLSVLAAATLLSGCVVVPVGPGYYSHGYHGYYYDGRGGYRYR